MKSRFSFGLAVVSFAGFALSSAPASAVTLDLSGWMGLRLDDSTPSHFRVNFDEIETAACGVSEGGVSGGGGGAVLVITNDGGGSGRPPFRLTVLSHREGEIPGTTVLDVVPQELELASTTTVSLGCGEFELPLVLNPEVTQPISSLVLVSADASNSVGTVAGNLTIESAYAMRPQGGGPAVALLSHPLHLKINGQWSVVTAGKSDGESPLSLLATRLRTGVVPLTSCWEDREPETSLCFQAILPEPPAAFGAK